MARRTAEQSPPATKKPEQVDLFQTSEEPKVERSDWLLASELRGPGALDRDAYLVLRIIQACGPQAPAEIVRRQCLVDDEWPPHRAHGAIERVVGAGFVVHDGGVLRERERERERVRLLSAA
jgi:hypothetical protein